MPIIPSNTIAPRINLVPLSPQARDFKPTLIDGQPFVQVPGGDFVMGHGRLEGHQPHWEKVDSFRVAVTPTTVRDYHHVTGNVAPLSFKDHPMTDVSWREFNEFMKAKNGRIANSKDYVGFGTAAEWEFAALGPALNIRDLMAANGVKSANGLRAFLKEGFICLQNFVAGEKDGKLIFGADILSDAETNPGAFQKLIESSAEIYAWRSFATLDGSLDGVYSNNQSPTEVSLNKRINGYGISDMTGNVWEFTGDENDNSIEPRGPAWAADDGISTMITSVRSVPYSGDSSHPLIGARLFAAA